MYLPNIHGLAYLVQEAAKPISRDFRFPNVTWRKGDNTPVTMTDLEVHQKLLDWTKDFSYIGYIGEEGNDFKDDCSHVLYVDPLDGTNAYRRGLAGATVVVSLMKQQKHGLWKPLLSVIHDPLNHWTWAANHDGDGFAQKDDNDEERFSLQVKEPRGYQQVTAVAWPKAPWNLERVRQLLVADPDMDHQSIGATALGGGLIASGLMDGLIFGGNSAVETAAMSLIVRNAGGVATDLFGEPLDTYRLVEQNGKLDFELPRGSIMSASQQLTNRLVAIITVAQQ